MPSSLLRPSQLARFWEKSPDTVMKWIRAGRLPAIRSPGGHYRLRVTDVQAFCERESMPVPPVVAPQRRRVVVWTAALARALRAQAVEVHEVDDPYEAMLAVAGGAALLVLPSAGGTFDVAAAIAALRRQVATRTMPIVVVATSAGARTGAIERAGATHVLPRTRAADLPALALAILGAP